MKKTTIIVTHNDNYEIDRIINNTALVKSIVGKSGLLNLKTNQLIGDLDQYTNGYNSDDLFFFQKKWIETINEDKQRDYLRVLRIYDTLNEKMIFDNWEILKDFGFVDGETNDYEVVLVKSPIDGKMHLFDKSTIRKDKNIFDMPFDDVEVLFKVDNEAIFVVTKDGKKGIYHHTKEKGKSKIIRPIEFDNIERYNNLIIYTKDDKKYFEYDDMNNRRSLYFDEIETDKQDNNIVYCKKGNKIQVYNTFTQDLIMSKKADDIKFLYNTTSSSVVGESIFEITDKDKHGITAIEIDCTKKSPKSRVKETTILKPIYDEIGILGRLGRKFYYKKDGKMGVFQREERCTQYIEPDYDNIEVLKNNFLALYKGDKCDIVYFDVYDPIKTAISDCNIIDKFNHMVPHVPDMSIIYCKDGKYGLFFLSHDYEEYDEYLTKPIYDSITNFGRDYFIAEYKGKKGVWFLADEIFPYEYDEIKLGGKNNALIDKEGIYFGLKSNDKWTLAKIRKYDYCDVEDNVYDDKVYDSIVFYNDLFVLRDEEHTYIYSYKHILLRTLGKDDIYNFVDYKPKYIINGQQYIIQNDKLVKVFLNNSDLYITTYEVDNITYNIQSYDKEEMDKFCSLIDSQEDESAKRLLDSISSRGTTSDYPSLTLSKFNK